MGGWLKRSRTGSSLEPRTIDRHNMTSLQSWAELRVQTYLAVTVAYGTCTMHVWLATTCPQTLIVTLGDVLEPGIQSCVHAYQ